MKKIKNFYRVDNKKMGKQQRRDYADGGGRCRICGNLVSGSTYENFGICDECAETNNSY